MFYESVFLLFIHAVLAPATAIHALLYKRDSKSAFGWIAACVLFPLAGPILYLFFGVNRVRGRARGYRLTQFDGEAAWGGPVQMDSALPQSILQEYRNLGRISQGLSRHSLSNGNTVTALRNGEEAYPAMLDAIASAENHIFLTTYLLDKDETGAHFRQALGRAVERGVDVRVMIDGVGDWYSIPRASRLLARSGIRVERFLPPRLIPPSLSVNMRNHYKILVIDDRIGFTGGMNIGDRHLINKAGNRRPSADMHFQLVGPVVDQLRIEFLRLWNFTIDSEEEDPPRLPSSEVGVHVCRTVTDGPDEDLDRLTLLLTAAIAEARHSVHIMTPYFLPPREIIGALESAIIRGVEVLIVLPEKNNLPIVHWATRNMLWELLCRGVRICYQPPPFNHTKLFVVDGYYTMIGSTNWDPRSLRLNFELQVEVYGTDFAQPIIKHIVEAARAGRPVTLEEVDGRPFWIRIRDALCWLFTPYL